MKGSFNCRYDYDDDDGGSDEDIVVWKYAAKMCSVYQKGRERERERVHPVQAGRGRQRKRGERERGGRKNDIARERENERE